MNDKPYKSIEEQIDILESRGVEITSRDAARKMLLSRGYYPLVNGYKDLLLDKDPSHQVDCERYVEGTLFASFETAMILDDMLRGVLYDFTMSCEQVMKNAIVQAFCSEYGGGESYLVEDWPRGRNGYRGDKTRYYENLGKLLSTLRRRRSNDRHKAYIQHYLDNGMRVPLWVLAPCLTFGEIAMFYDFLNDRVQVRACKMIMEASGSTGLTPKKLRHCFQVLTPFRNICAHYERVYCAKVGPNGQFRVKDVPMVVELVLGVDARRRFAGQVKHCFDLLGPSTEPIPAAMLDEMGFEYSTLEELFCSQSYP